MDSQARVASLDRVEEFRAAYAKFGDTARQALVGVDIEIRRMLDWLEKDIVAYWKAEIRRREEKVNEAKAALHRKRMTAAFGHVVGDTDELVWLRRMQARLEEAEQKLKAAKQWTLQVEQEVNEYRGPSHQLGNVLDADVPRALNMLNRALESLESYLQVMHPTTDQAAAAGFTSSAMPISENAAAPPTNPVAPPQETPPSPAPQSEADA